jgi:hypothetical protein
MFVAGGFALQVWFGLVYLFIHSVTYVTLDTFQMSLIFAHTGQPNIIPSLHKALTKTENVAAHDLMS